MLHKKVPHNIKKFRELKNVTREELADHLDMTLSGYAKIEQGYVDISIKKLELIAEFLKVSMYQLIEFDAFNIFNSLDISKNSSQSSLNVDNYLVEKLSYLKRLTESLERENALLREKLSNQKGD